MPLSLPAPEGDGGDSMLEIKLESLILAQSERWRRAKHMQVERIVRGNPDGQRRTGE